MELTLLCMLLLSSLNILLYCGNAQDAVLTFEPNWSTFFTGEFVTFICDMKEGKDSDWFYSIRKDGREFFPYSINNSSKVPLLIRGHSGEYQCHGEKKDSRERRQSKKVSLTVSDKDVILETPASTLFKGESVTLRCRHRAQEKNSATFYKDSSLIETNTNHQNEITVPLMLDGGSYKCKFDEDEESEPLKLSIEPKPKAQLSKRVAAGGSVILTCSVKPSSSSGWKYFWYRGKKTSEPLNIQHDELHVSQAGLYWCRGGRGEPVYYTEYSDPVVTNKPVVTQQPNWPEIYSGETITLICEIEGGGDAEWEYQWIPSSSTPRPTESMIKVSQSGNYWCKGHLKSEGTETEWSDIFTLKLSSWEASKPVLTVSPSWLSPGDSVALSCSVKHPSAGWSFYWFKAVPKLTGSYSYELLPGSTNGTDQDLFMVHGQTHSAGYVCRAGRGDPVFHTPYSEPKFVWSGDDHPAASLSVSLDTVQHFNQEPVSLSCEGNSTEWRVSRFSIHGQWTYCSYWGTMTGSTCKLNSHWTSGVYWCESGSGEFSNAVNITIVYDNDILLVSPAHPVAEGRPVTLVCKLKAEKALYDVHFYKNGKLIPNHTGGEMNISAVSKSDEGLYKCEGKESQKHALSLTSSESWMSVKYSEGGAASVMNSASHLLLIVGLVCGLLLIILLLLFLFHCRKSKDSCLMRSQSTNQGPGTDHMTNQEEPQHGDAALYESVPGSAEPENGEFGDVTYSEVELKNIVKKGKNRESEESTVYSNMKMGSGNAVSDDNLMYAQVLSHTKGKKGKGKSSPAAEDETVYSEVKPGTAFDK